MAALKGAFINLGAGLLGALPNIVVFQFNPEKVTRTPALAQMPRRSTGAGRQNSSDQPDPPAETYAFSLRLDATDQLAEKNPIAAASGVLPALSAIEQLMQPRSSNELSFLPPIPGLGGGGAKSFDYPPSRLPTVLFFWGPYRVWPVALTSLSIAETEYNTLLVPVRAEVTVNLSILTPTQLAGEKLALGAFAYSKGVREVMAALNLANAAQLGISASLSLAL